MRLIVILFCLFVPILDSFAKSHKTPIQSTIKPQKGFKPYFIGCSSDKTEASKVLSVIKSAQKSWNLHNLDQLISYYDPNFRTKDGMTIEQVRENLGDFWFYYNDAKISTIPTSIYICGNHASVNILEETTATHTDSTKPSPVKFKAWIRGLTILKKYGSEWRISQEEITTETVWKYHGLIANEVLNRGYVKLIVPDNVIAGENYIAQLEHNFPENIKALAFIDKDFLGEFNTDENSIKDKQDEEYINSERKRMTEISRILNDPSEDGLRRLFQANNSGQGELITAHIELIAFPDIKNPNEFISGGIISISQRVEPYEKIQEIKEVTTITKSLKDESKSK